MPQRLLEICVDSLESARAAVAGGADRLELCSSLEAGGLTPTPGLLKEVLRIVRSGVPIFCMIRCRPGGFVYTPEEMAVMLEDVRLLESAGAKGFVFGALKVDGSVDMRNCREVIMTCFPLPVTFHRAFDVCSQPLLNAEIIADLGFKRLLTSGQQITACTGRHLIAQIMEKVEGRLIVVPGSGISPFTLPILVQELGAQEYHASARVLKADEAEQTPRHFELGQVHICSQQKVAELANILKSL